MVLDEAKPHFGGTEKMPMAFLRNYPDAGTFCSM